MKRAAFLTVLLLTLTLSQMAFSQELASLTGVVADKTGAVIPDADVRLTDTKTNASYNTKSNSVGAYTFVKLLPGSGYKLVFTKDGFESLTISDIYIAVGITHTQNGALRIGNIAETVEARARVNRSPWIRPTPPSETISICGTFMNCRSKRAIPRLC